MIYLAKKFLSARAFCNDEHIFLEINLWKLRFCQIKGEHLFFTTIGAVKQFGEPLPFILPFKYATDYDKTLDKEK